MERSIPLFLAALGGLVIGIDMTAYTHWLAEFDWLPGLAVGALIVGIAVEITAT